MLTILGIETSCDETAAAIVRLEATGETPTGTILAERLLSQTKAHAPYGGVVPEIAARAHLDELDRLVAETMAGLDWSDLDGIAATAGPGLIGGLLVGVTFGRTLALARRLPFIPVNHLEGHALTIRLTDGQAFPYLLLLVSGGHCQLLRVGGVGDYRLYGETRDDAVGEAFDKAAKLLGLGYPGGPAIEAAAQSGDANRFRLPRPMHGTDGCAFSFSGLKTALRRAATQCAPLTSPDIADLAAGFQAAALDCLADRCAYAMARFAQETPAPHRLVVAGGVAANRALRARLEAEAQKRGFTLAAAPPEYCTDNAAMIAWAGAERLAAGHPLPPDLAPRARWPLDETPHVKDADGGGSIGVSTGLDYA